MFKLLEKKPFVRWKFVQRMVHKRRMTNRTGANRYKTFSKVTTSQDTEEFLDIHSSNDSIPHLPQTVPTTSTNPFNNRRKLDEANADFGLTYAESPKTQRRPGNASKHKDSEIEELNTTEVTAEAVSADDQKYAACEIEPTAENPEVIESLSSQLDDRKPQYNPISFDRPNKLRNSFKEFKRRSASQLGNARESIRRRTSARKYDNLDENTKSDNEEIVNYDHSPGSRRRPQFTRTESFRRSLRHSGKYILAGMQQLPGATLAQGMNPTTVFRV